MSGNPIDNAAAPAPLSHNVGDNEVMDIANVPLRQGTLAGFALFPKLSPELQHKIWKEAMQQPQIVPLRLERLKWCFLGAPLHPIFHTCQQSRHEAFKYIQSNSLELYPRQGGDERAIPGINDGRKVALSVPNDIFLVQSYTEKRRSPQLWQEEAREIARRQHNLFHREDYYRAPFVFSPTGSLWVERENDASNYFGPDSNDPLPAIATAIEKIATMLCLRPFNFHYGTEDAWFDQGGEYSRGTQDEDGNWIGGNGNEWNGTNLEEWAYKEVFSWFDDIAYSIFGYGNTDSKGVLQRGPFPAVNEVYVIVPEKNKSEENHYVFNDTLYPKAGVRGLLPWQEAPEGELIYTTKELRIVEQAMNDWARDSEDRPHTSIRELLGGLPMPKFKLVIADYDGRRV
ncbi:hypothetical protein N431DRAFT_147397 [Stipitochalara longipes BDJ]|nr:hypothetical protein N431DRAFT_147397 [Stipitochalara longipes BDJ]